MKKKTLGLMLSAGFVLFSGVALTACGQTVEQVKSIYLVVGENRGGTISLNYNYGETANIWDDLDLYGVYNDGDISLSSEEYASKVNITYQDPQGNMMEDWNIHPNKAGTYVITFEYGGYQAYLNVNIMQIKVTDFKVCIREKGTQTTLNYSTYKYAAPNYEAVVLDRSNNILDSSNHGSILLLTEAQAREYSEITTEDQKQQYLSDNALLSIGSSENGIDTTAVDPGVYYMYTAIYAHDYMDFCYSQPYSKLTVNKGDLIIPQSLFASVSPRVEYMFGNEYDSETQNNVYRYNTNQKALTLQLLNDYITTGNEEGNDQVEILGSSSSVSSFGRFEFKNGNLRVDFNDNTKEYDAKFVLDEYYDKYYEIKNENGVNSYKITLDLRQGIIQSPFTYVGNKNYEFEYSGETCRFAISEDEYNSEVKYDPVTGGLIDNLQYILKYNPTAINVIGNRSATNIGIYSVTFQLKDSINYKWYNDDLQIGDNEDEFYYYGKYNDNGSITFRWKINKISFYEMPVQLDYNDESVISSSEITYVTGKNSFRLSFAYEGNTNFNLVASRVEDPFVTWTLVDQGGTNAVMRQDGNDVIIDFTRADDNYSTITLNYSIAGTDYSNAFTKGWNDQPLVKQVGISKAEFTEQQEMEILGEIGAEKSGSDYRLDENHKIRISSVSMTLPNILPDYTDLDNLPSTADLGQWKFYHYENETYVEKHNGDQLESQDSIGWMFRFIPSNNMFKGFDVYVDFIDDIEFYNEDIPANIIEALKQDVSFYFDATTNKYISTNSITMTRTGDSLMLPDNTLVETSDNGGYLNYEGIEGRWFVYADDISFINRTNYYFNVGTQTEEWITSSDRVWTIQFVPKNSCYNSVVISVNVIIPNS